MTLTIVIIILIGILIIAAYFAVSNRRINTTSSINVKKADEQKNDLEKFPDRSFNIQFLKKSVIELIEKGELELANKNFAGLIESIRQQNLNLNGQLDKLLEQTKIEYLQFREQYNLDYPVQFLSPTERKKGAVIKQKFDEASFFGTIVFSDNSEYSVGFEEGESDKGKGRLLLIKNNEILFQKRLYRPNVGVVSNNGYVAICDYLNWESKLAGVFYIYDNLGNEVFKNQTTANLGKCFISNDSQYSIFETYGSPTDDSNKVFIINVSETRIISKFERPFNFINAIIDSLNKTIKLISNSGFIYEIDFSCNQINIEEYKNSIIERGDLLEKLRCIEEYESNTLFSNAYYLKFLLDALKDKDSSYSYGKDRLLLRIGEYYEFHGDFDSTIDYWEKAIKLNPNVGIKRKLSKYLKMKK